MPYRIWGLLDFCLAAMDLTMSLNNVSTAALIAVLITAAVIDIRRHRLPNILTVSAALLGISLQCGLHGWNGLLDGLAGFFTGLFLFLPFYAVRWMGAGAIIAFYLLAVRGGLIDYLSRYGSMVKCLFFTGTFTYLPPKAGETSTQLFPFAHA